MIVLAHREELIAQPIERLRAVAGDWLMDGSLIDRASAGCSASQKDYDRQLTVATVQTLGYRRKIQAASGSTPPRQTARRGPIDYLITDEAHPRDQPELFADRGRPEKRQPGHEASGRDGPPQRATARRWRMASPPRLLLPVTIADLVRRGYLVKPTWYAITTQIDLAGVKTVAGDFQQKALADRFDTEACRQVVVAAHKEYAADRPALPSPCRSRARMRWLGISRGGLHRCCR